MKKQAIAAVAAAALALTLSACSGEVESGEASGSEEAQDPADAPDYADTYEQVSAYLSDEYGILETGELCDEYNSAGGEEFAPIVERIAGEAGVTYEDQQAGDDAVFDAIYDWCEA